MGTPGGWIWLVSARPSDCFRGIGRALSRPTMHSSPPARTSRLAGVVVAITSCTVWAGAIEPSSRHETGADYQIDYVAADPGGITVTAPAGASVEIFEGLNRVAKGKVPLTFTTKEVGVFVVAMQQPHGMKWETHVALRPSTMAMVKAAPAKAAHPESGGLHAADSASARLSGIEFEAMKLQIKKKSPSQRFAELKRLTDNVRLSQQQAKDIAALFSGAQREQVVR